MKFKYALVARNMQPLAEYSMTTNSIRDIALYNIKDYNPNDRYSLSRINDLIFLSLNEPNRMSYLIVCEPSTKKDVAYNLLNCIQKQWILKYGYNVSNREPFSLNKEFGETILKEILISYNDEKKVEKLLEAIEKLKEAQRKQQEVIKRITQAFANGERLAILEEKMNNNFRDAAQMFHRNVNTD